MATVTETTQDSNIYKSGYKSIANKLGINENYLVTITANSNKLTGIPNRAFVGFTDETMSINYSSSWSTSGSEDSTSFLEETANYMFGKENVERVKGKLKGFAEKAGIQARTLVSSAKVWNGSSAISLHIPFNFVYYEDTKREVKDQIRDLMMLAAPHDRGLVMEAPGPSLLGTVLGGGTRIQCKIGKAFLLDHCIITDVSSQVDMKFDQKGNPIAAKVDVGIESFFDSATAQMLFAFFENKSWEIVKGAIENASFVAANSIMYDNESEMRKTE